MLFIISITLCMQQTSLPYVQAPRSDKRIQCMVGDFRHSINTAAQFAGCCIITESLQQLATWACGDLNGKDAGKDL